MSDIKKIHQHSSNDIQELSFKARSTSNPDIDIFNAKINGRRTKILSIQKTDVVLVSIDCKRYYPASPKLASALGFSRDTFSFNA